MIYFGLYQHLENLKYNQGIKKAKKLKIQTIGFYGKTGGSCKKLTNYPICAK